MMHFASFGGLEGCILGVEYQSEAECRGKYFPSFCMHDNIAYSLDNPRNGTNRSMKLPSLA
jgi:hypothetical protein